jgi:cytochrome b561
MSTYGGIARLLHWLIAALILIQIPVGLLMPNIRRGEVPGTPMNVHISIGVVILALILLRLLWRWTHPVAPHPDLTSWQRRASEAVHWTLYALVLTTTVSGWCYASGRGWELSLFWNFPQPSLGQSGPVRALGRLHENLSWALIIVAALHVAAALVHVFVYKDRVMQRMLTG